MIVANVHIIGIDTGHSGNLDSNDAASSDARQMEWLKDRLSEADASDERLRGARRIKHEFPSILVLVVSQFDSAPFAREAIAAGASGYVVKSNASSELIPMLRKTMSQHMRT